MENQDEPTTWHPRSNPQLECGHRLEDYCFCSEY